MPLLTRSIDPQNLSALQLQGVKQEYIQSDVLESLAEEQGKQNVQGKWSQQQNLDFVIFITYYQDIFSSKHKRKSCKIFKIFEGYLKERTAAQCRSHFQKMILKFKTVAKIRKHYENHFGKQTFRFRQNEFKIVWEQTHSPTIQKDKSIKSFKEIAVQTEGPNSIKMQQQTCVNYCLPLSEKISFTEHYDYTQNPLFLNQLSNNNNMGYYYFMPYPINRSLQL